MRALDLGDVKFRNVESFPCHSRLLTLVVFVRRLFVRHLLVVVVVYRRRRSVWWGDCRDAVVVATVDYGHIHSDRKDVTSREHWDDFVRVHVSLRRTTLVRLVD